MHGMQEVSGSIPLFSTKKALYFVGSTVLFFFVPVKRSGVHRSPCRRASDTPRSQSKPLSDLTLAVFSAPRRQLHAKARLRISTSAVFLWARVDYASRASKKAHRAVFAPSSATGPQLFESTRLASGKVITKQKLQYPVRILEFLVGAGGFEPPKLKSSRFTVCPHWPLGNTPISYFQSSLTACIFYHLKWHLSTTFSTDFLFFCRSLFSCVLPQ